MLVSGLTFAAEDHALLGFRVSTLSVAVVILGLVLSYMVHQTFLHPLRKIPGPFLAKQTDIWHLVQIQRGNRHIVFTDLHRKHGVKAIYGAQAPVTKSGFYLAFSPDNLSSFSMVGEDYKRMKALIAPAFSLRKLQGLEEYMNVHLDDWCKIVAAQGEVNITDMLTALSADVVSDISFGKSLEIKRDPAELQRVLAGFKASFRKSSSEGTMWRWPRGVLSRLNGKELTAQLKHLEGRAIDALLARTSKQQPRDDMFDELLKGVDPRTGKPYEEAELFGEAIMFLTAGTDTVAGSLACMVWHLLAHRHHWETLKETIRGQFESASELDYQRLQHVEFLQAVVEEGMRVCPPNPGILPRVVVGKPLVIDGVVFPVGTEIGICNMALHHNPAYFEDPDSFRPERWLKDSTLKLNRSAHMPFSAGPRACPGRNLAYMEMSVVLARIAWEFEMEFVDPHEVAHGYQTEDQFVAQRAATMVRVKAR